MQSDCLGIVAGHWKWEGLLKAATRHAAPPLALSLRAEEGRHKQLGCKT